LQDNTVIMHILKQYCNKYCILKNNWVPSYLRWCQSDLNIADKVCKVFLLIYYCSYWQVFIKTQIHRRRCRWSDQSTMLYEIQPIIKTVLKFGLQWTTAEYIRQHVTTADSLPVS